MECLKLRQEFSLLTGIAGIPLVETVSSEVNRYQLSNPIS
jgi:hypothetical protein